MIEIGSPEFIEAAKENRRNFLEPYRIQCEQLENDLAEAREMPKGLERANRMRKTEREFDELISFLLSIERSHVKEAWIYDAVENSGKTVELSGKGSITEPVKTSDSRVLILCFRIQLHHERMKKTFGSRNKRKLRIDYSIEEIWTDWNKRHPKDLISFDYLRKRFFAFKKQKNFESSNRVKYKGKNIELPFPYWLRHVKPKPGGGFEYRATVIITHGDQVLGHANLKIEK